MNRSVFNRYLDRRDFASLFITELGWNNPSGPTALPPIEVDGVEYRPEIVAQRNGFQIMTCSVDAIPTASVCRRIDIKLRQYANEYLLIFTQNGTGTRHLWLAPVKKVDKRDIVTTDYSSADQAEFIYQKIDNLAFGYNERTTIVDVRDRVQGTFAVNSEKITKEFYTAFKKEHKAFVSFIKGIEGTATSERDRQWYASVMLNRLMFCYFIQKKGFLNGEDNYLRSRFQKHVTGEQKGTFFRSFYLDFLRQLFQDGLNDPVRNSEFRNKYGLIPYLNGGMFDEHQIERDYSGLDIADEAFDRLFAFFDKWNWHLDTRITASRKDINPDVLGYIFEQYINDRAQMGAYYTKEDITEYIGRNCILPFLFDKTATQTNEAKKYFKPDGFVWSTLRESSERYIFDAVKHGFSDFDKIPENIRRGIIPDTKRREYTELSVADLPKDHVPLAELRKDWNTRTPERWGLPTEIWRETMERLERCASVLNKIKGGEITSINDFITYNLDIRQFAQDLLARADHHFIGWFYKSLQNVSILDPTCGSGAFLFAALNILEPLYEICIDRMQDFNRQNPNLFKDQLGEINQKYRSNIQYFIYKSIILRNLYGVDIMVEATEIAKLRLFLKMVAVVDVDRRAENMGIDPLPDIDFNIRCGNTLVGYATEEELNRDLDIPGDIYAELSNQDFKADIEEEMLKVKDAYNRFREIQLSHGDDMVSFKRSKHDLNVRLTALREQLDRRLHKATSTLPYEEWLVTHQPFHWLAEYYGIIQGNGGFDVIIGNPPYVEYSKVKNIYHISNYTTESCGNLYAYVMERCNNLVNVQSHIGMIVPMSGHSTDRMSSLVSNVYNRYGLRLHLNLSADAHPQKLFEGVKFRLSIFFLSNTGKGRYSTRYTRWLADERKNLFTIQPKFTEEKEYSYEKIIGKFSSPLLKDILIKIRQKPQLFYSQVGTNSIHYQSAPVNWIRSHFEIPFFKSERDGEGTTLKSLEFNSRQNAIIGSALMNSTTFFLFWITHSDCYHLNKTELKNFGYVLGTPTDDKLIKLSSELQRDMKSKSKRRVYTYKSTGRVEYDEFYMKLSKPIIDEIDKVLAKHYGFTEEELDFIINYDIKYRMGDELNADA